MPNIGANIGRALGTGLNKGLSAGFEGQRQQAQQQKLSQNLSDFQQGSEGLNEEQKFIKFAQAVQGSPNAENLMKYYLESLKQSKPEASQQEGPNPASSALDQLEGLIGKKGIGFGGHLNPSGEARFNRGKFNSLLAAVLPAFKSLFPRGITQNEFAVVKEEYLPQPHDTGETIKGKIAGLRELIKNPEQALEKIQKQQQQSATLKVYDKSGKVIGTIDAEEAEQLPEGYTAK